MAQAGLILLALGLVLFPFSRGYPLLLTSMTLMPLGMAFTFPPVTALLSRVVPSKQRGAYMGVQQTVGGVARVVFPWWNGWAFDHINMAAPFVVSGILTLGTLGLIRGITAPVKARDASSSEESKPDVARGGDAPQTLGAAPATERVGSAATKN
jgi:MFS family permease